MQDNRTILSVSELNAEVNLLLKQGFPLIWLEGEISNFAKPASGHFYFSLKDKQAQIRCAMFKMNNRRLIMKPSNGQQVLVRGKIGLYEPRGEFQLVVDHMEEAGEGLLQRQYQALKTKLSDEGLFDASRKKAFPAHPSRIGIISSATGAAIQDIINVLQRRSPHIPIKLYPVSVQGDAAITDILNALQKSKEQADCDVIILARGGGSIEDLQAFNDEQIARSIAHHPLPIITGIGHEIDFTIADFVADQRAPTPSAAAEVISPNREALIQTLDQIELQLQRKVEQTLTKQKQRLTWLEKRLSQQHPAQQLRLKKEQLTQLHSKLTQHKRNKLIRLNHVLEKQTLKLIAASPKKVLEQKQQQLAHLEDKLHHNMQNKHANHRLQLKQLATQLNSLSPLSTLERGYTLTQDTTGNVVSSIKEIKNEQELSIRMKDGAIRTRVISKELINTSKTDDTASF